MEKTATFARTQRGKKRLRKRKKSVAGEGIKGGNELAEEIFVSDAWEGKKSRHRFRSPGKGGGKLNTRKKKLAKKEKEEKIVLQEKRQKDDLQHFSQLLGKEDVKRRKTYRFLEGPGIVRGKETGSLHNGRDCPRGQLKLENVISLRG